MGQPVEKTIPFRVFEQVVQVALFLVAKRLPVGDEKLKITRVRLIHTRVVDFVHDAMAEREPDAAARMINGASPFFRTGGPAGFYSGCAECGRGFSCIHIRISNASTGNLCCPRSEVLEAAIQQSVDALNTQVRGWAGGQDLWIQSVMSLPHKNSRHPRAPDLLNGGQDAELVVHHDIMSRRIPLLHIGQLVLRSEEHTSEL